MSGGRAVNLAGKSILWIRCPPCCLVWMYSSQAIAGPLHVAALAGTATSCACSDPRTIVEQAREGLGTESFTGDSNAAHALRERVLSAITTA